MSKTDDDRPWEEPGCVRRDCEPHRGPFLRSMASFGTPLLYLSVFIPFLALLVIPVNITTWILARRDLARMRAGLMDPEGEVDTRWAGAVSLWQALVGVFLLVIWGLLIGIDRGYF
jgi:hypothetical protein